jgi:hypothetical protein
MFDVWLSKESNDLLSPSNPNYNGIFEAGWTAAFNAIEDAIVAALKESE